VNRSEIDFTIAITPRSLTLSLFRIECKIAYANRKYFMKQADMNNSPDQ
jgi:hypothetical protein